MDNLICLESAFIGIHQRPDHFRRLNIFILREPCNILWYIPLLGGHVKRTAKLFLNGRSQAIRLPAEFRFEGTEVFIEKDPKTGNLILSRKPYASWQSFLALRDGVVANGEIPREFMPERVDAPPQKRDLF